MRYFVPGFYSATLFANKTGLEPVTSGALTRALPTELLIFVHNGTPGGI
jgi:hypothetical protein